MTLNAKNRKRIGIDRKLQEGDILHIDVKLDGKDKEEKYTLIATTKPTMTIENNNTLGDGTTKTIRVNYPNVQNVKNYYTLDGGETYQEYTQSINLNLENKVNFLAKIEYQEEGRKTINRPISYLEALGITFSKITWQNGNASVQILANSKENIEYQINGTTEENWQKGYEVSNLNHNDILYARLKESSEVIEQENITIKDEITPTEFEIEVLEENIKAKSIRVDIKRVPQDNETGLKDYTYVAENVEGKKEVTDITKEGYSIAGLKPETEYKVYVLAYDNAGNYTKSNTLTVTTKEYIPPQIDIGETHTGREIHYTWKELSDVSKIISDSYGTEEGKINCDTAEVTITTNGKEYILGVGDWTTVNGKEVRILGFNHDELTDTNAYGEENTYAGISFEYVDSLMTAQINPSDTNAGGWGACRLRETLNSTIYNDLENEEYIKQVNKEYIQKNTDANSVTISQDKIWLLSRCEVFGKDNRTVTTEGTQYKFYSIGGSANKENNWWLRSPGYRICQRR